MVSEANEPGSESGKRSDDRRGLPEGTPQEGGASSHLAARLSPRSPGSFAAAAMGYPDSLLAMSDALPVALIDTIRARLGDRARPGEPYMRLRRGTSGSGRAEECGAGWRGPGSDRQGYVNFGA